LYLYLSKELTLVVSLWESICRILVVY